MSPKLLGPLLFRGSLVFKDFYSDRLSSVGISKSLEERGLTFFFHGLLLDYLVPTLHVSVLFLFLIDNMPPRIPLRTSLPSSSLPDGYWGLHVGSPACQAGFLPQSYIPLTFIFGLRILPSYQYIEVRILLQIFNPSFSFSMPSMQSLCEV